MDVVSPFEADHAARMAADALSPGAGITFAQAGGTSGGGSTHAVQLSGVGLHGFGDGWDELPPLWNDSNGNAVMPRVASRRNQATRSRHLPAT